MNNTKQNILNTVKTFVLCGLALGWLLAVAYGQESGRRGAKTKEPAAPEILSVRPIGMNGEPHLQPGKQVILLGRNFSPVLIKNRLSLRIVTDNPRRRRPSGSTPARFTSPPRALNGWKASRRFPSKAAIT